MLMRQVFFLWLGICNVVFAPVALAQTNRAVTLELQCIGQQTLDEVVITLRNSGNAGTAVVLGTRLGNTYLAKTLSFEARSAGSGEIRNFGYDNPTFSNSAGREDPWIVPLPGNSSYAVRISSNHFLSAASGERMDEVTSISDIQVHLTGSEIQPLNLDNRGLASWEVLVMDMQSAAVAVPEDCQ